VAADVLDLFRAYSWPGNVRELRNVLERAVVLAGEGTIRREHLPWNFPPGASVRQAARIEEPGVVRVPLGATLEDAEKALILRTLQFTGNNKTRAAEILGISLKTLHNKLKEYAAGHGSAPPGGPGTEDAG
jgi:DNA-binding NtrC family response regulator